MEDLRLLAFQTLLGGSFGALYGATSAHYRQQPLSLMASAYGANAMLFSAAFLSARAALHHAIVPPASTLGVDEPSRRAAISGLSGSIAGGAFTAAVGGARQGIIGAAAWGTASVMAQLAWDRFDAWRILERQRIESGHSSSGSEKKGSSHRQEAALSSESASFSVEDGGSSSPLPKGGPFDREQGRGKQEIQPKGAKLPSSTPPQWAAERPSRASVNGRPQNTLAQPVRGDDLASLSNAVATASADAASRVESTSAPAAAVAENASPRWFPIHRTNPDEQRLKKLRQRLANVEEALGLQGGRQTGGDKVGN